MFVERRPNAVVLPCSMYAALALVIISAIFTSSNQLGEGLLGSRSTGSSASPCKGGAGSPRNCSAGRFRDHIEATQLHPAAFATAVMLLSVGGVIAAALS
ncbi:hypothetical protein I551_0495 [Mycobacterium ulcerans str. Harvey]|uniref:Uncharacterized protein n=1 Tax=Mycobacterium ulcerans str. Harvey TaxID=1299332 RepID=A0ABN0R7B8_MYCUL|nr:hypothetical protein I551_0495 [Mycobacterium ulcerans str. Harvey]